MTSTTTILHPPSTAHHTQACHQCGASISNANPAIAEDAQRRISELETQVRILTGKATAAVDKLADYEDELRLLKSRPPSSPTITTHPPSRPSSRTSQTLSTRISSLLPSSHPPNPRTQSQPPSAASDRPNFPTSLHARTVSAESSKSTDKENANLLHLLTQEQTLRKAAETKIEKTNDELEELSAQLFTEANEMVAAERKARAKLEERVVLLEKRDRERRGRLEVLEQRLGRIERVRGLLGGNQ